MTNDPWDDDRLDSAYAARGADHPTSVDLTATTIEAIRAGAAPRSASRRTWPLAAAAAIVVVVGAIAISGLTSRQPGPGAATPSSSTAEPTPSASPPGTWPPDGATMVYVPGVEIAVVDDSGHMLGARDATIEAAALPRDLASKPVHLAATTTPGHLLLTWSGSGCDRRASVTIDAALGAISVERFEAPACEGDARTYGLILEFDGPVDVDAIRVSASRTVSGSP